MVRRIWAWMLTAVLVLSVLPVAGFAATDAEAAQLKKDTRSSYTRSLASSGKESLHGFCGLMISHQLWHMGVNEYPLVYDGKQQFDAYKNLLKTTGGYYISAYPAEDYTLRQALNAITKDGTRDVYNLLVGFEQTTTEAGALYGHACVINGILDGTVYFTESYDNNLGGAAGNVITCSIQEFVDYYSNWTTFEGVIYFGGNGYADTCTEYGTDIFVRTRFDMQLRSQPCLVGQEDCEVIRTVSAGERLRVTGVLEDEAGQLYYRVLEGDRLGYIVAQTAVLERTNPEELYLKELVIPETVEPDQDAPITGTVRAKYGLVGAVEIVITDSVGNVALRQRQITDSYKVELADLNKQMDLSELGKGMYTVSIYADTASAYVREDALDYSYATMLLQQQTMWIGEKGQKPVVSKAAAVKEVLDGWYWQEGTWYCYANDKPRTGWVRQLGVEYYLQEDGSVTTGWAEIDGQQRYFSHNGAMCVGWLNTEDGMRYSFSDGRFADGWQTIGTSRYYFDRGILQTEGTRKDGDVKYEFQPDGRAVVVEEKK